MIPVIKVSTKDKRSRVLQLDISLEGPDHSGLQAAEMMKDIMQEFSMCRPLMLVLKKILHDRGLLTAYTGGLSSYGLFLMCTRYLQEQASSWSDCGALLMGFLDFAEEEKKVTTGYADVNLLLCTVDGVGYLRSFAVELDRMLEMAGLMFKHS